MKNFTEFYTKHRKEIKANEKKEYTKLKRFSPEFKKDAIALTEKFDLKAVHTRINITKATLERWRKDYTPPTTTPVASNTEITLPQFLSKYEAILSYNRSVHPKVKRFPFEFKKDVVMLCRHQDKESIAEKINTSNPTITRWISELSGNPYKNTGKKYKKMLRDMQRENTPPLSEEDIPLKRKRKLSPLRWRQQVNTSSQRPVDTNTDIVIELGDARLVVKDVQTAIEIIRNME